jgi:cobalt-zinc-cadmium efflux system outer membrane protein
MNSQSIKFMAPAWCIGVALCGLLATSPVVAADKPPVSPPLKSENVQTLTLDEAVQYALEHNPELAALRQQRGIASAGVVIARAYPFNPVWEGRVRAGVGPASAGITNRVANEHNVSIDVEVRGQGEIRRQQAYAALSRAEWEVAGNEVTLAVRVVRAYYNILYRREKLKLIEEGVALTEKAAEQIKKLREGGKLNPIDAHLADTDLADARAQRGPGRAALVAAWHEFRRGLGVREEIVDVKGTLTTPAKRPDAAALLDEALEQRPDLRARQAALSEAEAKLRLEIANRYGNPNFGSAYEYDSTRVNLIGVQWLLPLPVVNTKRGEILQRQEERRRAALELTDTDVRIRQDVYAAVARLEDARTSVKMYDTEILPSLRTSLEAVQKLFDAGDATVDVMKVSDVRRKLLKARDGYLDAQWELSQAQADLDAALGLVRGTAPR